MKGESLKVIRSKESGVRCNGVYNRRKCKEPLQKRTKILKLTKFRLHLFQNHPPLLSQVINGSLQAFIPKLNNLKR